MEIIHYPLYYFNICFSFVFFCVLYFFAGARLQNPSLPLPLMFPWQHVTLPHPWQHSKALAKRGCFFFIIYFIPPLPLLLLLLFFFWPVTSSQWGPQLGQEHKPPPAPSSWRVADKEVEAKRPDEPQKHQIFLFSRCKEPLLACMFATMSLGSFF